MATKAMISSARATRWGSTDGKADTMAVTPDDTDTATVRM